MEHTAAENLFSLKGRTILLTGGAGGLGITLARALLEYGADVIISDIHAEPPETEWNTLLQVAGAGRDTALYYHQLDTTDEVAVHRVFIDIDQAIKKNGRYPLRGLVACAGISERIDAVDYPIDRFRRIIDTNISGTFLCAQAAARSFRTHEVAGSILIIASMSGSRVNRGVNTSAYNASKAALHQLTRSLAAEWGSGAGNDARTVTSSKSFPSIRVNSLSPGYIRTEATAPTLRGDPALERLWESGSMLGRLSWAEEYRAPVLFLLADGSSYVTGSDLRVDGGATAW